MASFDLWLDGPEMDESAGWKQAVALDFDRFASEPGFAEVIHRHIQIGLEQLAREIGELSLSYPPGTFQPIDRESLPSCE